jgi:predicted DNA-binding transcriptional regulator YafY
MAQTDISHRQITIINLLKTRPADLKEIIKRLEEETDKKLVANVRTIQRDFEVIREMYGITIKYDKYLSKYKIVENDEAPVNERILEAFNAFNAFKFTSDIQNYVQFEERKPMGTQHLYGILHAIKNRQMLLMQYQKFWSDEVLHRELEPYMLKEFEHRWYVVGKDRKDNRIKTYGLDRILDFQITNFKFEIATNFRPESFFANCYGILTNQEIEPVEIILSFTFEQGKYVKTLPLHPKQEILMDNEEELRIKLFLKPTYDLEMKLMSFGESMLVIQPESLQKRLVERYQEAIDLYE